jgi:hypothetical protein
MFVPIHPNSLFQFQCDLLDLKGWIMIFDPIRSFHNSFFTKSRFLPLSLFLMIAAITTGCGGNSSSSAALSGNTTVTVVTSSTANDSLFDYVATLNQLTLTSESGTIVNLLSTPLSPEFIHVNGKNEPLNTISIPQGIYTTASALIGWADFTCATINPESGILATHQYALEPVPNSDVTINLPSPITITGDNIVLSLDLLVSQSESYPSCYNTGIVPYTITPTFTLVPKDISSNPTNSANGKMNSLEGMILSIDSSSLVVYPVDVAENWQVATNGSTLYQGINGISQLAVGMAVDMDADLLPDGSLLATRISVYDTNPTDVNLWVVPMLMMNTYGPQAAIGMLESIGPEIAGNDAQVDFSKAVFNISGHFTNLASLPFQPSFLGSNMVAGQLLEITFHSSRLFSPPVTGLPVNTITLMPQTINGTVSAISSSGGFTTYTITLASYDLFSALAVDADQNTLLADPSTVVVYADSNTQMLNSKPIDVGSVVRFNGLVFNDNGTLRMDCGQINDGVAE